MLNPFEHPIVFTQPERLSDFSVWRGHIPFAMLLVDLLRPRLLVELGTHWGDSYCAFCQAVTLVGAPTRCVAVDTWSGDEHAGYYENSVYDSLRTHHDARYAEFSTLRRATFDEAQSDFADKTIDLLHIDGLHTYEAVRHDFEHYFSKLSDKAIVLFHDTAVRDNGFGVWQFWDEIRVRFPSFAFTHAGGLGMVAVGTYPPSLAPFFEASPEETARLVDVFARLGSPFEIYGVAERWAEENAKLTEHAEATSRFARTKEAELAEAYERMNQAQGELKTTYEQLVESHAQLTELNRQLTEVHAYLGERETLLAETQNNLAQTHTALVQSQTTLADTQAAYEQASARLEKIRSHPLVRAARRVRVLQKGYSS